MPLLGNRLLLCGVCFLPAMSNTGNAQVPLDRLLSLVEVRTADQCSIIDIAFNRPVTFGGKFPSGSGIELSVEIDVLDTLQTMEGAKPLIESASVPAGNGAGLTSVTIDPVSGEPALLLSFNRPVRFHVSRDTNSRHIVVIAADAESAAQCPGTDEAATDDTITEAKKSLAEKDYARAIALFTKAAASVKPDTRREAQELLGLARERAGQLAHARAEYESYLKAYPSGATAERVRQRLSGVVAAIESDAAAQFSAKKKSRLQSTGDLTKAALLKDGQLTVSAGKGDLAASDNAVKGWHWDTSGSIGQFYYRDDGFAGLGPLHGSLGTHDVNQNDIVSSADVTVHGESGASDIKVRMSGYNQTGFDSTGDDRTNLSAAYVDMRNRLNGLSARVGRQTRSGGGVFGRFDGALLGLAVNDTVTVQAVAGSPVYYGDIAPFADGRYFYGASLDLTTHDKVWSGTLYAIEQDVGSAVDRRAIGAELRHARGNFTGYAAADYDIFYNEINNTYVSGSWAATNGLSVYGSLDYRHVPFLLTSNALMGQSVDSLSALIDLFGTHETQALAVDRTASASTATAGFSYDFPDKWQVSLEGTIAGYSGTPASGGVDGIPDPGIEYYLSAQLNGSGIFKDNDFVGLGLRYLESASYQSYIADVSLRYPVNEKLRINPRLRLAYRNGQDSDFQQFLIMPSLGLKYQISGHWNFESEVAARWEDNKTATGNGQNAEFLLSMGYRYQF